MVRGSGMVGGGRLESARSAWLQRAQLCQRRLLQPVHGPLVDYFVQDRWRLLESSMMGPWTDRIPREVSNP